MNSVQLLSLESICGETETPSVHAQAGTAHTPSRFVPEKLSGYYLTITTEQAAFS
jgi:hypothetical protein